MTSRNPDPAARLDRAKRRARIFRSPPRRPLAVRRAVQVLTLLVTVAIGLQFAHWVGGVMDGARVGVRPPGVEGFLPISALISLRHWVADGTFSMIHPAGLVIFGLACLTALFLKKAFCSWLCPVGTVAEALARLSHLAFRRRIKLPTWLDRSLRGLKYLLAFYFVYAVFVQMSPHEIAAFLNSPYNKVADIKMLLFFTQMSVLTAKVLGALVILSFVVPYFWCRFLCPYGALLGLLSSLSPLKIERRLPDCTACGHCAAVCPAFLDVDRKTRVADPECTGCLECVAQCPAPEALAVRAGRGWRGRLRPVVFAAAVLLIFFGGIGLAKLSGRWRTEIGEAEFMRRAQELDSPKYHHARGRVPEYGPGD